MRACSKCCESYEEDGFYIRIQRSKPTAMRQCKLCVAQYNKRYASQNSTRAVERAKRWAQRNPERHLKTQRRAQQRNRECDRVRLADYKKAHPELNARYAAFRRAARLNATPAWADQKRIKRMYELAALFQRSTGIEFRVDHILPLKGKRVCGLHTHENLRVVSKAENLAKSNREPEYANG